MTFRTKLIAVSLLPIVLISFAALWLIDAQSRSLAEAQGQVVEKMIRDAKQTELQNYLKLARAAIDPFYKWDNVSRLQAQKQVAEVITNMNFGNDGYFFVSRSDGKALENPILSELRRDEKFARYGEEIALFSQGLVESDFRNDNVYQYKWEKPSTKEKAAKLGMAVYLPNWDWVIGSGLYTDEISEQIGQVQAQLDQNLRQTRWVLIALAVGAIALTSTLLAFVRFSEQRFADQRLKDLASELVEAQETERKRVSTELHDGISQLLVSAQYGLDIANDKSKNRPNIQEPIQKSMDAISTAIAEIRRISMALRPSILDDMGLAAALKSLGSDFQSQTGIKTTVTAANVGASLNERAKTTLYRVAQESLANVAKHSKANNAQITLEKHSAGVSMRITDDGVGMPVDAKHLKADGMGLRNIRERLESHGGTFIFERHKQNADEGITIDVFIPLAQNSSQGNVGAVNEPSLTEQKA